MANEAIERLTESGASVPIDISPEVEEAGVTPHHEDREHGEINKGLEGTGASVSSAAVPISTQDSGLIRLTEKPEPDKKFSTSDSQRYVGIPNFLQRIFRAKQSELEGKEKLKNAA